MLTSTARTDRTTPRLIAATLLVLSLTIALLTSGAPKALAANGEDTLWAGQSLLAGQRLVSANGQFQAAVQSDGNVVVYGPGGARWQTGTRSAAVELAVQSDGNVVLYGSGRPLWWTGTSGSGARLVMQSDGNLVVYLGDRAAWSITTGIIPVRPSGPAELVAGQVLWAGGQLVSADGRFVAALQTDGNFVTYGPGNRVLFATGTGGTAGARLAMQTDGNLVLYGNGGARWQTGTSGSSGVLALQNDGNLVVYAGGRAAWARTTGLIPVPVPVRSILSAGETLGAGQQLTNGRFAAAVQTDGNFVVYDGGRAVFSTGTGGRSNAVLAMQSDGNLVLYGSGRPQWQTGTRGSSSQLALQSDGNLVVYAGGRAAWSVRTGLLPYPSFSGDGDYAVGRDISAGTYRTRTGGSSCYWERLRGFSGTIGDVIANDITNAPSVVTIAPSDAGFSSSRCATWTADLSPITAAPTAPFGDGTYIVNSDVAAGTWAPSEGATCYWERLRGFSGQFNDLIANDFGSGGWVTISPADIGFTTNRCGVWTKVG